MRRILFVDDEPSVLNGLRRMLYGMRREWEMEFAGDARQALGLLAKRPFDIVVSDMRMPGMDGAELLHIVMQQYPDTVRIILSGQAERENALRSIGPTHQYLSKPCDESTLKATLAKALTIRQWMAAPTIQHLVSSVTSLPSLPAIYQELLNELQSPEPSIQRVGDIVASDVGMTAKIMQLVNSSYFALRQRVSTPTQAVVILGVEVLRALVLSLNVFSEYEDVAIPGFDIAGLFQHSLIVGKWAKVLAKQVGASAAIMNEALVAGMLHDVGKLVLAGNLPEQFQKALMLSRAERLELGAAELEVLGCSHAEVGAYLLGLWGLSDPIIEAVAFHHSPARCSDRGFNPLAAVHLANYFFHECQQADASAGPRLLHREYLDQLGIVDHSSITLSCIGIISSVSPTFLKNRRAFGWSRISSGMSSGAR
jgi:putative nucleotidyltransferase with HDIG domain